MLDFHRELQKDGLSFVEIETVYNVCTGDGNLAISNRMCVAEKTIKWRLTNIYKKLGMTQKHKTRYHLIVKYLQLYMQVEANKPKPVVDGVLPGRTL